MAGGGLYRTDQVQFAVEEEAVDGTAPGTIDENLGIIKDGIRLPDLDLAWDPFFGVGRSGRARKDIHKGPESFSASIPRIYVGHETSRLALEMAIGELSQDFVGLGGTDPGVITGVTATTMTDSGENFTTVDGGGTIKGGDHAVFSGISVGYIDTTAGGGATEVTVYPTPARSGTKGWNGAQPAVGDEYEIRKTESVGVATGDKFLVPTQNLHTMTWAVRHRNATDHGATSVGSFLTVNYLGGKVNRATLSARMGEKLMLAYDEVLFRDLRHDSALPSSSVAKYSGSVVAPTASHPTEEPLVFSQGTIALFELANSFARIRSFSIAINNNLVSERYISKVTVGGTGQVAQSVYEITEGDKVVTMEIEAVMETREFYEHLVRQGQNDGLSAKTGFDIFLKFENAAGTEFFYIQGPAHLNPTLIADDSLPINTSNAQATASNVGCVVVRAPHAVPGEGQALITVPITIDVPSLVMWWTDA